MLKNASKRTKIQQMIELALQSGDDEARPSREDMDQENSTDPGGWKPLAGAQTAAANYRREFLLQTLSDPSQLCS